MLPTAEVEADGAAPAAAAPVNVAKPASRRIVRQQSAQNMQPATRTMYGCRQCGGHARKPGRRTMRLEAGGTSEMFSARCV